MATPTPSSLGASAPGLLSPRYRVLLAGVFSQLLCIGIARFAYTPLLPVMQQQAWLSDAQGGWLAALNYAGYMLGALTAASISSLRLKDRSEERRVGKEW